MQATMQHHVVSVCTFADLNPGDTFRLSTISRGIFMKIGKTFGMPINAVELRSGMSDRFATDLVILRVRPQAGAVVFADVVT